MESFNYAVYKAADENWGIFVIKYLQKILPPNAAYGLNIVSHIICIFIPVLISIYFICRIDYKKGIKLCYLLSSSFAASFLLQNILRVPRPFIIDKSIHFIYAAGFSSPSSYALVCASFYPVFFNYLNNIFKKTKIFLPFVFLLPLFAGVINVYAGKNYPADIFLGWAAGGIISCFFIFAFPLLDKKIENAINCFEKELEENAIRVRKIRFAAAAVPAFIFALPFVKETQGAGAFLGLAFGRIFIFEPLIKKILNTKTVFTTQKESEAGKVFKCSANSVKIILCFCSLGIAAAAAFLLKKIELIPHGYLRMYSFAVFFAQGTVISGLLPLIFFNGDKNA